MVLSGFPTWNFVEVLSKFFSSKSQTLLNMIFSFFNSNSNFYINYHEMPSFWLQCCSLQSTLSSNQIMNTSCNWVLLFNYVFHQPDRLNTVIEMLTFVCSAAAWAIKFPVATIVTYSSPSVCHWLMTSSMCVTKMSVALLTNIRRKNWVCNVPWC